MSYDAYWEKVGDKARDAITLIERSVGRQGYFAGSGDRYLNQYWTRDFALAIAPAIAAIEMLRGPEWQPLIDRLKRAIRTHLISLVRRQGKGGAMPILFADLPELLARKIQQKGRFDFANRTLSGGDSFVLNRIFDGMFGTPKKFPELADFDGRFTVHSGPKYIAERGLYRLTPGTTDSELLFTLAALDHGDSFTANTIPSRDTMESDTGYALQYVESRHVRDGLMVGADWRDTMEVFFADKYLLTNNAVRYHVHKRMQTGKHKEIARRIEEVFWNGETYLDYPGSDRFDPLGASLAVLYDLVPPERYDAVLKGFKSVNTLWGVTIKCRHNAYAPAEKEVIERTDGVVVWPFVCGFTALASFKMGETTFALDQLDCMNRQTGFGEWYDPKDGTQYGEPLQGWSAALFLRVCAAAVEAGCVTRGQLDF